MPSFDERDEFLKNPYFQGRIYGNFTPFYITIAVCAALGFFLFALNIIFGCCSKHRQYWQNPHTGNRWIVSLWTATPHSQPPLDLSELSDVKSFYTPSAEIERPLDYESSPPRPQHTGFPGRGRRFNRDEFLELQKRESDI